MVSGVCGKAVAAGLALSHLRGHDLYVASAPASPTWGINYPGAGGRLKPAAGGHQQGG